MLKELSVLSAFFLLLVVAKPGPGVGDFIADALNSGAASIESGFKGVATGVETGVKGVATGVESGVKGAASDVKEGVKDVGHSISNVFNVCDEATFTTATECAILYDHHRCIGWAEPISSNGYQALDLIRKDDTESVVVKKGCTLIVHQHASSDPSQRGTSFTIDAKGKDANVAMDLNGSAQLHSAVSAVECKC